MGEEKIWIIRCITSDRVRSLNCEPRVSAYISLMSSWRKPNVVPAFQCVRVSHDCSWVIRWWKPWLWISLYRKPRFRKRNRGDAIMFIIKREIRFNHFNNDELEKEFEKFVDTFSGFVSIFNFLIWSLNF